MMADQTMEARNLEKQGHWRSHIESWKKSGLSQIDYCRQNDLSRHRFTYWKCKVERKKERIKFLPVYSTHALTNQPLNNSALKVMIGNRYRIEVGEGFSEDVLCRLMHVLERL